MAGRSTERMTPEEVAALLRRSGSRTATAEKVQFMIQKGAPADENGLISLLEFTAWLMKRTKWRN